MKKGWVVSAVVCGLVLGSGAQRVLAQQEVGVPQVPYDQMTQELEKSRQMLEIWKDHVRELTQERDEAYQEIDKLKSGEGPAQQFGVETAPLPASGVQSASQYARTLEELRSQISSLQSQNDQLKLVQREVKELEEDKAVLVSQKEQALAELETFKQQGAAQPAPSQSTPAVWPVEDRSAEIEKLTRERDEAYQEIEALKSQSAELRNRGGEGSLEALEVQYQRMEAQKNTFEKLYTNLEYDFEQQGGKLKELSQEIDALQNENARLSGELSKTQSLQESHAELLASFQAFREKHQALQAEKNEVEQAMRSLQSELSRLKTDHQSLQGAYTGLKKESETLRAAHAQQARTIHDQTARLNAHRTDLRNFKSNVESYLESLTQNFEEKNN